MKDKDATFAILAGGLSSRMEQDKALLPIQGEPLIQRVVNRGKAISESPFLILVGCDMPLVNLAMLSFQLGVLDHDDVDVVVPKHANGLEPLHSVYRREICLDLVKSALDKGERSLNWMVFLGERTRNPGK